MAVQYHEGQFPPEQFIDWPKLIPLIGPTSAALARYDGMLAAIPNPDVLLAPLTTREAVLSSRIEGTQATMGEVLAHGAGYQPSGIEKREDIREVLGYLAAMRQAETMLKELPMSLRVVRNIHAVLLEGVRGRGKAPGEFRRTSNWIGPPGCSIDNARFVPIRADKLAGAMGDWERYMHREEPDQLVQLAVLHAEFEALHPFLDGNGRLGRMLVPLFLWQRELIRAPSFYISSYFEARREEYYDGLLSVSRDGDWTGWCRFFLEAVREQAVENLAKTTAILKLYEDLKIRVSELTRSQHAIRALDWLFAQPIFSSTSFVSTSGISAPTSRRILKILQQNGVLKIIVEGHGRQPSFFAFPELLNIVDDGSVI